MNPEQNAAHELPEPAFRLIWKSERAAYAVTEPNIGDTDVYTADQMRAALEAARVAPVDEVDTIGAALFRDWHVSDLGENGPHAYHRERIQQAIGFIRGVAPVGDAVACRWFANNGWSEWVSLKDELYSLVLKEGVPVEYAYPLFASPVVASGHRAAEWGEYLAVGAERFIDAVNAHAMACGEDGAEPDPDAVTEAESAMTEYMTALRSDIYEFRKRAKPDTAPTAAGEDAPVNGIRATWWHSEGARARCSYCKRYTLDLTALGDRQPECECGRKNGWSGSFATPDADAKWSGRAPTERTPQRGGEELLDKAIEAYHGTTLPHFTQPEDRWNERVRMRRALIASLASGETK